jgi:hypothetical protein
VTRACAPPLRHLAQAGPAAVERWLS